MCILCALFGAQLMRINSLPPMTATFLLPKAIYKDESIMAQMTDLDCMEYITRRVGYAIPNDVVPLKTTGDGNCLLHAVSRALWGVEIYYDVLRRLMANELRSNQDWYRKIVISPQFVEKDFVEALEQAERDNQHLQFLHVFALANVLKRPVIIYASDADEEKFGTGEHGVSATFLPTRFPVSECKARPIAISWSTRHKNHYVPIVVKEGHQFEWPIPEIAWKSSIPEGVDPFDYIHQHAEVVSADVTSLIDEESDSIVQRMRSIDFSESVKQPDFLVTVKLRNHAGATKTLQIGCQFYDDPYDVAKKILAKEGIINPSYTQSLSEMIQTELNKNLDSISKHIPIRSPPTKFEQRKLTQAYNKILEYNKEVRAYMLSDAEITILQKLIYTIENDDIETSTFSQDEIMVLHKLTNWDDLRIFPVIHLMRALILHHNAVEHFLLNQELLLRPFTAGKERKCSKQIRTLSLQFLANILATDALRSVMATNYKYVMELLRAGIEDTANLKDKIIELVVSCLMSFSSLLFLAPRYLSSDDVIKPKIECIDLLPTLIQQLDPDDAATPHFMYQLFQCLGTLAVGDEIIAKYMNTCGVLSYVQMFKDHPNTEVKEVVLDFIKLINRMTKTPSSKGSW